MASVTNHPTSAKLSSAVMSTINFLVGEPLIVGIKLDLTSWEQAVLEVDFSQTPGHPLMQYAANVILSHIQKEPGVFADNYKATSIEKLTIEHIRSRVASDEKHPGIAGPIFRNILKHRAIMLRTAESAGLLYIHPKDYSEATNMFLTGAVTRAQTGAKPANAEEQEAIRIMRDGDRIQRAAFGAGGASENYDINMWANKSA